jgi:hypothetical protein
MPELKLSYRHNHLLQPHYPTHADIEGVAMDVRRQLGLSNRRALTIDDLAGIDRLNVNGVKFDLWVDLEHQLHDDAQQPVLGLFEFTPESSMDAVSVCVSPIGPNMSAALQLSTFAHELGHAIFDGPALVAQHRSLPLTLLNEAASTRAFRLVTESTAQLDRASQHLPSHIRFSELRANEFMGSLLVPRDVLWEAIMDEAPKHALNISYGEETLFAESLDGNMKIMWSPVSYDVDCYMFTRTLAPHFGVNPAFIDVRMMRYGIIPQDGKPS